MIGDAFPAIEPPDAEPFGDPIDAVAHSVTREFRRSKAAGFDAIGLPIRPIERGPVVLLVARGYAGAGRSTTVATMNAYRPCAFESAAVLAHAANSHRELVGALRFLTAAASALLREPGAGRVADLRDARTLAGDVLFRLS